MCTRHDDDYGKCLNYDSFQDWCRECLDDWFAIIGEDKYLVYNEDEDDR
jgi:hypothetical protein